MSNNTNLLKIIGNNIRQAREHKNYTQEQLAEQLNTSSKFISMVERGLSGLSIASIVDLCKVLDIEPNSFFNGIINYNNEEDSYIVNALSTLSMEDKDFIISVINYVMNRNSK